MFLLPTTYAYLSTMLHIFQFLLGYLKKRKPTKLFFFLINEHGFLYFFKNDCSIMLVNGSPWLLQRKVMSSYDVSTKTVGVTTGLIPQNQTSDILLC